MAIRGLQLVAYDAERGILSTVNLVRIKEAMSRLVEELEDHEDLLPSSAKMRANETSGLDQLEPAIPSDPLPHPAGQSAAALSEAELAEGWSGAAPVLCISGRGLLDGVASEMLQQLLGKNGLAARAEPYEAASRSQIASLDVAGVAMVCISSLEITGNPSHLRYLVRRLRHRLPQVPILVGLFPLDDASVEERLRAAVGADFYAASLRNAVNTCLRVARGEIKTSPQAIEQEETVA